MSSSDASGCRFGPDFVAAHQRRFGKRPPEQRQLTYDHAVLDEFAPFRGWLDQELDLLPPEVADKLAQDIWLDEHFWPVTIELATGSALRAGGWRRRAGLQACFDPPSGIAGRVSAKRLAERLEAKTEKYAAMAEEYGVPLGSCNGRASLYRRRTRAV